MCADATQDHPMEEDEEEEDQEGREHQKQSGPSLPVHLPPGVKPKSALITETAAERIRKRKRTEAGDASDDNNSDREERHRGVHSTRNWGGHEDDVIVLGGRSAKGERIKIESRRL